MNVRRRLICLTALLLSYSTLATASTFAQIITHAPQFNFESDSRLDLFGAKVSGAGDVDGDGFDDLIVGIQADDTNGPSSGRVKVFSGADGTVVYDFFGDSADDQFGTSVSGAGDVNDDGFDDLIVGAPKDGLNGAVGSVWVFSGIDGSVLYRFDGDVDGERLGQSVSDAGDVNGDGFNDLIAGASRAGTNGVDSGRAIVFSGSDGSVLHTFLGDSEGDFFGSSVSGASDVNGDGFDDLIVGAFRDDNNGTDSGTARVFSGVDGAILYTFDGDSSFDSFGESVSRAGDVNGDGFDDLIVGARSDDNNGSKSGSAKVFSGVDGSVMYSFDGDQANVSLGDSVSGAGDVNGDGYDDLIVGIPGDDDAGSDSGSARVLSGANGSVLYNFFGDTAGDTFGESVSSAGDVNDDGIADLIVGGSRALASLTGGRGNGYVRVFVSQPPASIILGDCNLDGVVNFLDISAMIQLLGASSFLEQADCNQDGELDFLDIASFIDILSP